MMQEGFDIEWLLDNGSASDLLDMLTGKNEYADHDTFDTMDRHSRHLRRMTLQHLEFLVEYGDRKDPVCLDGKVISPYPEYLEAWKLAGCPGISVNQLERLAAVKRNTV